MKTSRVKYEVDVGNKESCLDALWQEARESKCTSRAGKSFLLVSSLCLLWTRHSGGILNAESQRDSVNHSEVHVFKGEIDAHD